MIFPKPPLITPPKFPGIHRAKEAALQLPAPSDRIQVQAVAHTINLMKRYTRK